MIEESAVFIEVEDEDQTIPLGALLEGIVDIANEALACLDVAVGVVVVGCSEEFSLRGVVRIDEGDVGERSR
jgi:hypothetical protein